MRNFQKITTIFLILAVIFSIFPFGQAKAEEAGRYGYLSRIIITQALDANAGVPEWKKVALLDQLSVDGYFWLKTKQDKLDYIHANLPNNQYLSIVADAENIHNWTVKPNDYDDVTYKEAEQGTKAFVDLVERFHKNWFDVVLAVFKATPKEVTYQKAYFDKHFWREAGQLDTLYGSWKDFAVNKDKAQFTALEKRRLRSAYEMINPEGKEIGVAGLIAKMPSQRGIRGWGIRTFQEGDGYRMQVVVNDEERWNFVVTGQDLAVLVFTAGASAGEQLTWIWLRAAGFKMLRPILNVGSRVAERAMATGAARVVKRATAFIIKRSFNFASDFAINVSAMFGKSTIKMSRNERAQLAENLIRMMDTLAQDTRFKNALPPDFSQRIAQKIRIMSPKAIQQEHGGTIQKAERIMGFARGKIGSSLDDLLLVLNENSFALVKDSKEAAFEAYLHELAHLMLKMSAPRPVPPGFTWESAKFGYEPVGEGLSTYWQIRWFEILFGGPAPRRTGYSRVLSDIWTLEDTVGRSLGISRADPNYLARVIQVMAKASFEDGPFSLDARLNAGLTQWHRDRGITSVMTAFNDLIKEGESTQLNVVLNQLEF